MKSTTNSIERFFGRAIEKPPETKLAPTQTDGKETGTVKRGIFFLLALFLVAPLVSAQSRKPSTIAELAVYRGVDREQLLFAGAKGEGKITWYSIRASKSSPIAPREPNWSPAWRRKAKRGATSRTRSRPRRAVSYFCATKNYSVPMTRRSWTDIRKTAKNAPIRTQSIGLSPESRISG